VTRRGSVSCFIALLTGLTVAAPVSAEPTLVSSWGSQGRAVGQFTNPSGLAVGAGGQVYVADSDNYRIQRFGPDGQFISAWGSPGSGAGQFQGPADVATDSAGNVYVADFRNHRVQKFDANGVFERTWGYDVNTAGSTSTFQVCTGPVCRAGTAGTSPGQFFSPQGVAVDGSGNVYVTEFANNRVQKFTSSGAYQGVTWGSTGSAPGQFNRPMGLTVDASGAVYVTDRDNARIQKFNPAGALLTSWGTAGQGNGQFAAPRDVAVDPTGNVQVADWVNRRVQRFSPTGGFLSSFAMIAPAATPILPLALAYNQSGDLYILEQDTNRVLRTRETSTPQPPAEVPPPVLGRAVNVEVVSGRVLVAVPRGGSTTPGQARASQKGLRFVPLTADRQIPVGSFLNTRRGTVRLTSAAGRGTKTQAARFSAGLFQVLQSRRRRAKGLTELRLKGSSFRRCRTRRGGQRSGARAARLSRRTIRRLRGRGRGRFRTKARYSAGLVRGTVWITADRCDGTLTTVKRGKVAVRDFRRHKTVTVRAGHSYLARAPRRD
jgi:streptogramin lyase